MPPALPAIRAQGSAGEACEALREAGWREVGRGDWCWVFADPGDQIAARVTPWDRAYRLHVDICRRHPANPFLQRIEAVVDLAAGGYVTFMERLWPPDEAQALALCHALGFGNDSGWDWTERAAAAFPETAALSDLRTILAEERDEGAARLPFWSGSDISPKNVMADAAGQLKVIEAFFVSGWKIVGAIETGDPELRRHMTLAEVEAFLSIPRAVEADDNGALLEKARAIYRSAAADPV